MKHREWTDFRILSDAFTNWQLKNICVSSFEAIDWRKDSEIVSSFKAIDWRKDSEIGDIYMLLSRSMFWDYSVSLSQNLLYNVIVQTYLLSVPTFQLSVQDRYFLHRIHRQPITGYMILKIRYCQTIVNADFCSQPVCNIRFYINSGPREYIKITVKQWNVGVTKVKG